MHATFSLENIKEEVLMGGKDRKVMSLCSTNCHTMKTHWEVEV